MHSLLVASTVISNLYRRSDKRIQAQKSGRHWDSARKMVNNPTSTHHHQPRISSHINHNYCVNAPSLRWLSREQKDCQVCKYVSALLDYIGQFEQPRDCKVVSVSPNWTNMGRNIKSLSESNKFCKLSCCKSCTHCKRSATKERLSLTVLKQQLLKICEKYHLY